MSKSLMDMLQQFSNQPPVGRVNPNDFAQASGYPLQQTAANTAAGLGFNPNVVKSIINAKTPEEAEAVLKMLSAMQR
jgi:hypothetical protein